MAKKKRYKNTYAVVTRIMVPKVTVKYFESSAEAEKFKKEKPKFRSCYSKKGKC